MRKLKFRAWDKKGGGKWLVNLPVCIGVNNDGSLNCFADGELSQFTNLYDVDGREIWEGDIVLQNGPKSARGLVEFRNGNFVRVNRHDSILLSFIVDTVKVIGNIYENPELLNQSTNQIKSSQ